MTHVVYTIWNEVMTNIIRLCVRYIYSVNIADDRFRARSEFIKLQSQMVELYYYYYYLLLYKTLNVCMRYSNFKNRYYICIKKCT